LYFKGLFNPVTIITNIHAVFCSYSILNLATENQYVLNLDMSLCIQESTCEETFSLLKDARIPKIGCEWSESLSGID
jgi:hypothetical protein